MEFDDGFAYSWDAMGAVDREIKEVLPEGLFDSKEGDFFRNVAEHIMTSHVDDIMQRITTYNDARATTHKDILKIFDKVIKSL